MVFQWLLPLGFLGLLSLAVLLLIYILRPRYLERIVASTYPWKRALKKRKKRIPFDRFSNILVFLCQVLILTACAMILARPTMISEDFINAGAEKIIILDAGMNMPAKYAEYEGKTNYSRFERAIHEIKAEIDQILFEENGTISLILAEKEPRYLLEDEGKDSYSKIVTELNQAECSYGIANLEAAIEEAQEKLNINPQAQVEIFSGTDFGSMGDAVTVHNLSDTEHEWNIAILGVTPVYEENQYLFDVEVAAYGNVSRAVTLEVEILGIHDGENTYDFKGFKKNVIFEVNTNNLEQGNVQSFRIEATDPEIGGNEDWYVPSFREVKMEFIGLDDSISEDNSIHVYGGEKDQLKVQYYSVRRNVFFFLTIYSLQEAMRKTREIEFNPVYDIDEEPESSGFDFYIYEHDVPLETFSEGLPDDGVLIFCDPTAELLNTLNLGVQADQTVRVDSSRTLKNGSISPITDNISAERITISEYLKVKPMEGSGYTTLLYCGEDPVLLSKKIGAAQIVIMPFSINNSNIAIGWDLVTLFHNILDFYMPITLNRYAFEIDEKAMVNCKGALIEVTDPDGDQAAVLKDSFPVEVDLSKVGVYTFTTRFALNKPEEIRRIYVQTPKSESSLFKVADLGLFLNHEDITEESVKDMFLLFAIAIVALLFVEWWLQFQEIL